MFFFQHRFFLKVSCEPRLSHMTRLYSSVQVRKKTRTGLHNCAFFMLTWIILVFRLHVFLNLSFIDKIIWINQLPARFFSIFQKTRRYNLQFYKSSYYTKKNIFRTQNLNCFHMIQIKVSCVQLLQNLTEVVLLINTQTGAEGAAVQTYWRAPRRTTRRRRRHASKHPRRATTSAVFDVQETFWKRRSGVLMS